MPGRNSSFDLRSRKCSQIYSVYQIRSMVTRLDLGDDSIQKSVCVGYEHAYVITITATTRAIFYSPA
jgi:hypothetical protein